MTKPQTVTVSVESRTTALPGRALTTARNHHFIVDEPAYAGGLEEEITPVEAFLGGISSCAVGVVGLLAQASDLPLKWARASVEATWTRQTGLVHEGVTCIESLRVGFEFRGLTEVDAGGLVEAFKGR